MGKGKLEHRRKVGGFRKKKAGAKEQFLIRVPWRVARCLDRVADDFTEQLGTHLSMNQAINLVIVHGLRALDAASEADCEAVEEG